MEEKNPKPSTDLRFDLINPHAVAYARTHLSEGLGPLKEGGREIIQREVTRAMSGQQTSQQVARIIRDNALALTPEQVIASDEHWKDLIKKGLDANTINRRMAKFNARQLQNRAETIAHTETHRAAAGGQLAAWREAQRQRVIEPGTMVKVWYVAWDDRLCPACEGMDGVAVGLDETFARNRDGTPVANSFGELMEFPDMHPNCRCTFNLVHKDQLEEFMAKRVRPTEKPQSHRP